MNKNSTAQALDEITKIIESMEVRIKEVEDQHKKTRKIMRDLYQRLQILTDQNASNS